MSRTKKISTYKISTYPKIISKITEETTKIEMEQNNSEQILLSTEKEKDIEEHIIKILEFPKVNK